MQGSVMRGYFIGGCVMRGGVFANVRSGRSICYIAYRDVSKN